MACSRAPEPRTRILTGQAYRPAALPIGPIARRDCPARMPGSNAQQRRADWATWPIVSDPPNRQRRSTSSVSPAVAASSGAQNGRATGRPCATALTPAEVEEWPRATGCSKPRSSHCSPTAQPAPPSSLRMPPGLSVRTVGRSSRSRPGARHGGSSRQGRLTSSRVEKSWTHRQRRGRSRCVAARGEAGSAAPAKLSG